LSKENPVQKGAACCCVKENQCCSNLIFLTVCRSVNWLNPLVKLIWGYWCRQLDLSVCLPRCDSTRKSNLDIPLVARIVYCLIQILKVACLTEMKSVVQLHEIFRMGWLQNQCCRKHS
jgi:hypothetical protein